MAGESGVGIGDGQDVEATTTGSVIAILKRIRTLAGGVGSFRITDGVDEALVTTGKALHANLRDNAGTEIGTVANPVQVTGGGGGTQYDEDTAHVTADKVTLAGVVQQTADAALSGDGDRSLLQVDASGFLKVNIKAGAGSGGTALADEAAFTEGTTQLTPVGGVLNDTITSDPTEDQAAAFRITPKRALHANLRNVAGAEIGVSGAPVRTDPTGTTTQPVSAASLPLPTGAATEATLATRLTESDYDSKTGALTEAAPATDTASSGLNGRLQRIAQRLTSLIALLPAALVSGRLDVNLGAAPATVTVQGVAAHDAAVSGNPVRIGGKANLNEPAVVQDGDAVDAWLDLLGRQVVLAGHPNPEPPVTANGSAAGLSVIATPGASLSLYICKGSIHNSAAAENIISLRDGAAGTIRFTVNAAADGGGTLFDFGSRGWKLTANTALVADIGAATGYVNVTEYYIAA